MKRRLLLFVSCATGLAVMGSVPLASSPAFDLGVDTTGPAFAFAECGASAGLTYRTGDTVTVVRPDETLATLVSAAGENGVYAWTKPLAGGVYTLTNSGEEGSVTFSVRFSDNGTEGAGTAENPAKIVDGAELRDLAMADRLRDGYVFTLFGPAASADSIERVPGYAIAHASDGAFSLVESTGGLLFANTFAIPQLDTRLPGPDRRVRRDESRRIAYSGNGWRKNDTVSSSLAITAPDGTTETSPLVGTGTVAFPGKTVGVWHLALTANGETLESDINVNGGTIFIIR